jgi:hypothetical protein
MYYNQPLFYVDNGGDGDKNKNSAQCIILGLFCASESLYVYGEF